MYKDGNAERVAAVVGPGANVVILNAKNGNELNFKELPDGGNTHDLEVELENGSLKPGFILNASICLGRALRKWKKKGKK